MSVVKRNHVQIIGTGQQPIIFAHGFGCDQGMWRFVTPAFERDYKVVLFDHVGSGQSDVSAYNRVKYNNIAGYADDLLEICHALDLTYAIFVGHSVSCMVGVLAALQEPERFAQLVLVSPSPCYINKGEYVGGFSQAEIDELLDFLDSNYLGWSQIMAPVIMSNADRPVLGEELTSSFCRTDPTIAKQFARVTFLSDNRAELPHVKPPCLILQCTDDVIAPIVVGEYMHRVLPSSQLVMLDAVGHCPNLSAPDATIAAIQAFL